MDGSTSGDGVAAVDRNDSARYEGCVGACEEKDNAAQVVRGSPTPHRNSRQERTGLCRIVPQRLSAGRDPSWCYRIDPHAFWSIGDGKRLGELGMPPFQPE